MTKFRTFDSKGILARSGFGAINPSGEYIPPPSIQPPPAPITLGTNVSGIIGNKVFRNKQEEELDRQQKEQLAAEARAKANQPSGGGKIICAHLHSMGLLDDTLNALDQAYGAWLMKVNPRWQTAYLRYARRIVPHLNNDRLYNRLFMCITVPLIQMWAREMGNRMGGNYKRTRTGTLFMGMMIRFFLMLEWFREAKIKLRRWFKPC